MRTGITRLGIMAGLSVALSACVNSHYEHRDNPNAGRYSERHDSYPDAPMDVRHIEDATPKVEPKSLSGNKSPYKVLGQTYYVLEGSKGYRERGIASWYGRKFHGHQTSSGEIYNMYGMTAAHKSLPLPSYVEVTNLDNGRKVIVRVNDRGPFHKGRIIDVTYSAAKKLGFVNKGTARVEVVAIDPVAWQAQQGQYAQNTSRSTQDVNAPDASIQRAPTPVNSAGYELPENTYLQVGAFSSHTAAETLRTKVQAVTDFPVTIKPQDASTPLFRVRIGPIADNWRLLSLRDLLQTKKLATPYVVYE
ncbi:endolytic peptidoglycan transglycosylase RlpA [Marinibactrum halimedae]|uniref:Endolytic peptidoglycan transglycosylase RlpA n=2 Tax=Marinibactrum halimedae TaxID=1444977 RepID=A0AA37WM50_9GAMM|nr:endolytic peptidoglycan transglycosylase RlpA [Marinibactrum halimedae]